MEFLLEIGVEDLPADVIATTSEKLAGNFRNILDENHILYESSVDKEITARIQSFVTVRRLVVKASGLPPKQPGKVTEVPGPPAAAAFLPDGSLSQTGLGYCRAHRINPEELKVKDDGRKKVTYYVKKEKGRTTRTVLLEIIPRFISSLSFELPMRWGDGSALFVRPVTSLLALLDDKVLPVTFAGVKAKPFTSGHPTLASKELKVKSISDYFKVLPGNFVVLDDRERFRRTAKKINKIKPSGANFCEKRLNRIVQTLEYPQVVLSRLDLEKVPYPKEVAALVMKKLKCLPLYDKNGNLLPELVIVADGRITGEIKKGFHWVLESRLEDALFFWQEDTHVSLQARQEKLTDVIFQAGIGTLSDYAKALENLTGEISSRLNIAPADKEDLAVAARMAKIDITTSMVREFPDVAGIMAASLLKKEGGYSERVCEALKTHLLPRYSGDDLPQNWLAQVLSFSDKLLHLCGLFLAGAEPSGSSDPYGLRRLAQGLIEVAWAGRLRLSLGEAVSGGVKAWGKEDAGIDKKVSGFLCQRLENIFENKGFRPDIVGAGLAAKNDILTSYPARISALSGFVLGPGGPGKATTFSRVTNILVQAKEKGITFADEVQPQILIEEAEKELFNAWNARAAEIGRFLENEEFGKALAGLSELDPFINRFFDRVLVMAPDETLRNNRLGLLEQIASVLRRIGDLSKLHLP